MRLYRYDKATGVILEGGYFQPLYDPATQDLFPLEGDGPHPDPRLFRVSAGALRQATAQEIADFDAAAADASAKTDFDGLRGVKAAVVTSLRGRLGRQPTAQEIAAERTVFIAIYKLLG